MKKLFLIAIACLAMMMPANAQILKRIGESAARAAESAVSFTSRFCSDSFKGILRHRGR